MRKALILLTFGLFVLASCGGGGGEYADAKKVIEKTAGIFEDFANEVEKAEDAGSLAKALNKFADGMEAIKPEAEEIEKKYPDIKNAASAPEELKPFMEKIEGFSQKIGVAFMKAQQFKDDPEVAKALERLQNVMK